MTPQTQDPEGVTSPSTVVPAVVSSQTPDPPTSQQPATLHPDVYAPDGKRWRDKFYGYEGAINKVQKDAATAAGAYDQTIADLQQQIRVRDSQLATHQTSHATEQAQLDSIPGLQQKITELEKQAGLVDIYRALTEYPDLLNIQVEQTVPATEPDGQPTTVKVNPLLSLIESSNLPPDALKAQLAQLATFYRTGAQIPPADPVPPATGVSTPPPGPPAVPSPATPTDTNSVEYWRAKAREASLRVQEGDTAARIERREAWDKVRELERAATS